MGRGMPNTLSEMTEPTTSFADSGEGAISQKIEVSPDLFASTLSADKFSEYYDIDRTANEIAEGGYKCVCPVPCRRPPAPDNHPLDRAPVPRRTAGRLRANIQSFEIQARGGCPPVHSRRHIVRKVSPVTCSRLTHFTEPQLLRR